MERIDYTLQNTDIEYALSELSMPNGKNDVEDIKTKLDVYAVEEMANRFDSPISQSEAAIDEIIYQIENYF